MPVFLGDLELTDWELPSEIPMGGQHEVVVHRTIGGRRIVDAMGPDDAVIEWTGHLFGPTAGERALQLDLMRRDGQQRTFAYDLRSYNVVISHFSAEFKLYPIPYKIALTIVEDLVADLPPQELLQLEAEIAADLALAAAVAESEALILEAIAAVQDAILLAKNGMAVLKGIGNFALAQLKTGIAGAVANTVIVATQADAKIETNSFAGIEEGDDPETMAAKYRAQVQAVTDSSNAVSAAALLSRVQANINNVPP